MLPTTPATTLVTPTGFLAIAHQILVVVVIWIITPTSDHHRHGRHLIHRTSPGLLRHHCLHVIMCCPWHPNPVNSFVVARFVVPRVTQPLGWLYIGIDACLISACSSTCSTRRFQCFICSHYTHPSDSRDWVVDSGASHHVTTDLATFSLHEPYSGSESVFIGNGTCLYNYLSLIWLLFLGAGLIVARGHIWFAWNT